MLEEVTSYVKAESALKPLPSEEIRGNQSDETRSEISTRGFCSREHSLTLGYWIAMLNVTKANPCVMK